MFSGGLVKLGPLYLIDTCSSRQAYSPVGRTAPDLPHEQVFSDPCRAEGAAASFNLDTCVGRSTIVVNVQMVQGAVSEAGPEQVIVGMWSIIGNYNALNHS